MYAFYSFVMRCSAMIVCVCALLLPGCDFFKKDQTQQHASPPSPAVGYVVIESEKLTLTTQLPGRTTAYLVAEVRPQVSGILQARLFTEGVEVKEGDILYQIDPAPFQAAYNSAKAALARDEASLVAAQLRAKRANELVKSNAVSVQEADDANAAYKQALAVVAADKAALEAARINLDYASIAAPISGKIGRSSVTQGALLTANQPNPLATIQQLDPIYVDVTQSSLEMLRLRRNLESGQLHKGGENSTKVRLVLEDGTPYALEGELQFSEVAVDQSTGSVTLRAMFPNPNRVLLPGMFVRAVLEEGVDEKAILVPQEGVARDFKGRPTAMVVKDDNTLELRELESSRTVGDRWLVTSGLKPGDKVVVEGLLQARPGMTVRAEPAANRSATGASTTSPNGGGKNGGAAAQPAR